MNFTNTTTYPKDEVQRLTELAIGAIDFEKVVVKVKKVKSARIGYSGRAYPVLPWKQCYAKLRIEQGYKRLVTVNLNEKADFPMSNIVGKWQTHSSFVKQSKELFEELKSLHSEAKEIVKYASHDGTTMCTYIYRNGLPYGGVDSVQIQYNTWQEVLVGVMAHEACHIYQFENMLDTSEAQCEWFAASQLELYRNGKFEEMKKSLPFDV